MALDLTLTTSLLTKKRNIEPNLILEIEGIDTVYSAIQTYKIARYGEDNIIYGQDNLFYGQGIPMSNNEALISLDGSSSQLNWQLLQDKGGFSSVASLNIELIDKDQQISKLISPGFITDELLTKKAKCYISFNGASHPDDSVLIHKGIIKEIQTKPASCVLVIAHPEQQKRQELFVKQTTKLTQDLLYESALIQSIKYFKRSDVAATVYVQYTSGATAGNEVVTVSGGNTITVQIQPGVSTANQIRSKLNESGEVQNLVSYSILSNQGSVAQTATGLTQLVTDLTINVQTTNGFLISNHANLQSYVQINDEIIKVTALTQTTFTATERGALRTVPTTHSNGDDVISFFVLTDSALDLALKLMLSNADEYYASEDVLHIGAKSSTEPLDNILFFKYSDIKEKHGLTVGDKVKVTLSGIPANNVIDSVITGFGKNDIGSWIVLSSPLTIELNSPASAEFKSKYNVLSEGMGMTPDDVDVERHETFKTRFSSTIADYTFYIKDTINGKDFLSEQIYVPSGFYSIPRKARASVGITLPPIAEDDILTLDEVNVVRASELRPTRSVDKNFYNAYVIKYDEVSFLEKFASAKVFYSADSQNRIKNVGNRPSTIEAKGLRSGGSTDTVIRINSRRFLERYEFASEYISNVKVLFKDGFKTDIGDTVVFGSPGLKVTDIKYGSKDFQPKLYEIVNKKLDLKTGDITLDILSTNFEIDGRYGVVSPSSLIESGNTNSVIIKDSYSTAFPNKEKDKWEDYIGEKVYIHNQNYTVGEEITLLGFDPQNDYKMLFDGNLSFTPDSSFVVDIPFYPDSTDSKINSKYKLIHCFFDPQLTVLNPISQTVFDVSDPSKVFVGSILRVHNDDFSVDSQEVKVNDITGSTVTTDKALGINPLIGYKIDLIGFKDKGLPYRLI